MKLLKRSKNAKKLTIYQGARIISNKCWSSHFKFWESNMKTLPFWLPMISLTKSLSKSIFKGNRIRLATMPILRLQSNWTKRVEGKTLQRCTREFAVSYQSPIPLLLTGKPEWVAAIDKQANIAFNKLERSITQVVHCSDEGICLSVLV